jgi:tRNA dimethylallyltransferase
VKKGFDLKQLAILGPTACGKTALSIEIATKYDAIILSLDSLSIYKQIDIASAKPTKAERGNIVHFGIDEIFPNETFNVTLFFELYKKAFNYAKKEKKNLIIVGGTGFYLKAMIEGLNDKPQISLHVKKEIEKKLLELEKTYALIEEKDPIYAQKISQKDTYRIEKWLEIYLTTGLSATKHFQQSKKEPLIKELKIFEIELEKEYLRQRIGLRTDKMIQEGLIEEVLFLEKTYTRAPNCMSSIGIKETFGYLDGYYDLRQLAQNITTNTARLAKRQRTFNTTQLPLHVKGENAFICQEIQNYLQS